MGNDRVERDPQHGQDSVHEGTHKPVNTGEKVSDNAPKPEGAPKSPMPEQPGGPKS